MIQDLKLAIFDLDGTLADTVYDIADCASKMLSKYGDYPSNPDLVRKCIGNGAVKLIDRMCRDLNITQNDPEEDISEFKRYYAKSTCACTKVYEGVFDILERLKKQGVKIAVATMKPKKATETCLKATGLDAYIDLTLSFEDMEIPKPDGWCVRECMRHFNVKPENTIMVGDGMTDVQAGLNAGVTTVAILGGYFDKEIIRNSGATYVLDNMGELASILW